MKVKLYATLRPLVNAPEVDIPVPPGEPISKVLEELVREYPQLRREIFDEDGRLRDQIHVFVNGRDVRYLKDGLETRVQEGDDVRIFPPVGGGR